MEKRGKRSKCLHHPDRLGSLFVLEAFYATDLLRNLEGRQRDAVVPDENDCKRTRPDKAADVCRGSIASLPFEVRRADFDVFIPRTGSTGMTRRVAASSDVDGTIQSGYQQADLEHNYESNANP